MADQFTMPDDLKGKSAEEIAQLYVNTKGEYEKYKGEWEPRSQRWSEYEKFGDPKQIEEVFNWSKSVAAPIVTKVANGEAYLLNDADYKAYKSWADKTKNGTAQDANGQADNELFAPLSKQLEEKLLAALDARLSERTKSLGSDMSTGFKRIQDQINLFTHLQKLQKDHPNLDFDAVLKKASDYSSMPSDQLLNAMTESEIKLSSYAADVEKGVAARLAEMEAERQNASAKALIDGRGAFNGPKTTPGRADAMKTYIGNLDKKFPGILEQIPLTR